jgi:hypothetical protein
MKAVTMPNMPSARSAWREDVAVPGPHAGVGHLVQHRVALTRRHVDRVARDRLQQLLAVLGDDPPERLVQVHRVRLQAFVVVVHEHGVADLRRVGLGRREALAVERETDHAGVVEHHVDLLVGLGGEAEVDQLLGHLHLTDRDRSEEAVEHLLGAVVRVVDADCRLERLELVHERLAGHHGRLGERRHAVHRVRDADAVPVDHGAGRQLVLQHDPDHVADLDVDVRGGHGAVVGPGLHDLAGLDLPLLDHGGDLEGLEAVVAHRVLERLAAELALGLLDESQGPLVHRDLHLLGRGVPVEVVGALDGGAVGVRAGGGAGDDVEVARHAAVGMAGDLAQHRVHAHAELAQRQVERLTGLQVGRHRTEHRQVVHLRVDVGDAQGDLAGGRHDVLGQELERSELDLDDRGGAAPAAHAGSGLAPAHAPEREEAEHERPEGERDRGPVQEGAVVGGAGGGALPEQLAGQWL